MNDKKGFWKKIEELRDKPYAVPVYALTVVGVSLPLIFSHMDICLMNIIVAIVAIVVPYHLYKDKDVKKVVYAGVIALLLIAIIGTLYHVHIFYSQEPVELESENLSEGLLEPMYGDSETSFDASVRVRDLNINQVLVNFTFQGIEDPMLMDEISYELEGQDGVYSNNSIVLGEERVYNHHFSLNYTEGNVTVWEETDSAIGPLTISRGNLAFSIMLLRTVAPFITFFLVVGLIWWMNRMKTSRSVGKDEFEKKEADLDDYCEKCGNFLDEDGECPDCGGKVRTCSECGVDVPEDADICQNCDSSVE